jgi:hypothetical protein
MDKGGGRIRKREESEIRSQKSPKGEKSRGVKFLLKKLEVHVKFGQPGGGRQEYFQLFDRRGRWSRM